MHFRPARGGQWIHMSEDYFGLGGGRVETWQNEGECLRLPVCIVACLCISLSVCEV